jgi:hypothetical protein
VANEPSVPYGLVLELQGDVDASALAGEPGGDLAGPVPVLGTAERCRLHQRRVEVAPRLRHLAEVFERLGHG